MDLMSNVNSSLLTIAQNKDHFKLLIRTALNAAINIDCGSSMEIHQYEPPRGKTNNVVSEQVRHKSTCTSTEKS